MNTHTENLNHQKAATDHLRARAAARWTLVVLLWIVAIIGICVLPAVVIAGWRWVPVTMLERFLTVSGQSARALRNRPPARVPETQEYIDARAEARALCRNLGLDVANEHWDGASVADFVRLAYAQGWKGCESRIYSRDTADAIAAAIKTPGDFVTQDGTALSHQVAAVQRAVVHGVPK